MHQYKTIAQTLLVLSILNLVFAAPVVPREVRDRDNDVVAEDGTTVSERRRATPLGGTTPSQYPSSSSDGSPPHGSFPLGGSAPLQGSVPSSESAHLSATDGHVPESDSITEASTSAHPLSATDGQVSVHDSTGEASTSAHPLPAADGAAPEPNSIMEASSTSSHHSVTDVPMPVPDSTVEGSTTKHYTAITLDMVGKDKKFYQKATVQKIAGLTLIAGVSVGIAIYQALHKNDKDD